MTDQSVDLIGIDKLLLPRCNLTKWGMGPRKRAHTSEPLLSLGGARLEEVFNKLVVDLYYRMFKANSPFAIYHSVFIIAI